MKGKMSFDFGTIQRRFVDHVEKVVFTAVIGVLVLFGYRALSREVYESTPEELQQVATAAENKIAEGGADPGRTADEINAEGIMVKISAEPYKLDNIWKPPIFETRGKRGMPPHFTVEDLRVAAGHGAMGSGVSAMGGYGGTGEEMGGVGPTMSGMEKGKRWAVVTGLIPYARQVEEYEDAFGEAVFKDQTRDVPRYFAFKVERAEIANPSAPGTLNWETVSALKQYNILGGSPGSMGGGMMPGAAGGMESGMDEGGGYMTTTARSGDIHPEHYVPTSNASIRGRSIKTPLTFPLPSVSNHLWGPEVCHRPEIPLADELELVKPDRETNETPTLDDALSDDPLARGRPGPGGAMPGMPGGGYGYGGTGEEGYGGTEGYGYGGLMGGARAGYVSEEDLKYRLFRFFDFSVDPGKHYRYRFALLLWNPNYKVEPQYLMSADLGKKWYVETEFSDPSEIITVPRDSDVLAGPVTPRATEPRASVGILHFNVQTGVETFAEFETVRGRLLNFPGHEITSARTAGYGGEYGMMPDSDMGYGDLMGEPGAGMGMMAPASGDTARGSRTRKKKKDDEEPPETIDLLTGAVLLDMRGGSRLPGGSDMNEPGQILLLNLAGRLVVRNELDDEAVYTRHKPVEKRTAPDMGPYGEGDMGGELDGYGGGYPEEGGRGRRGRRPRGGMLEE